MKKIKYSIILLVITYAYHAVAQDYMTTLQKSANNGSIYAQLELGYAYKIGDNITQNLAKSKDWFRKAAEKGNPYAQYELGNYFLNARNYQQALEWYKKSAEKAFPNAEYQIGRFYQLGYGVKQDYNVAVSWFEKSAMHNNPEAYYPMAQCYIKMGTKKYCAEITSCYRHYIDDIGHKNSERERLKDEFIDLADKIEEPLVKAAEKGNPIALLNYGWALMKVSPYQSETKKKEEYHAMALHCIEASAALNNTEALRLLGVCYKRGLINLSQSNKQAIMYYLQAAKYGDAESYNELGNIFEMGSRGKEEIKADIEQSLKYYHLAAQGESVKAYASLGQYYYNKKEYAKAKKWLKYCTDSYTEDPLPWLLHGMCLYKEKLFEQAYSCFKNAQRLDKTFNKNGEWGIFGRSTIYEGYGELGLGIFFYEGKACNIDYKKAFKHLKNASESYMFGEDLVVARNYLAACYFMGRGTTENQKLGEYWREKAQEAKKRYEKLYIR